MRSMVASATANKLPHRLYLFCSNRTPEAAAFLTDFEAWQKENKNFTFIPVFTDTKSNNQHSNILENVGMLRFEHKRIDAEMIRKYVPDWENAFYFIAGPPAMVTGLLGTLTQANFDTDNIKTEEFAGY